MDQYSERLSRMDSCAVSDALDKLGLSGSVTGILRVSTDRRIAGRVLTVKLDRAEGRNSTRHLCTAAIEATIAAKMRGVAGAIIEGPARDIDESRQLDFPVFARTITGRTARGRIVEVSTGAPVVVGDVIVNSGDYVIADGSSVVFVAQADIGRVVDAAELIVRRESLMAQALRDGKRASEVMGANYEHMLKK